MRLNLLTLACTAALLAAPAAHADTANLSFETGDLTDWTATAGLVEVVTDADDATGGDPIFGQHYTATDGTYFAKLSAGDGLNYTMLTQTFTLTQRSRVSVDAAFLAFDYLPYNDDAFVRLTQGSNVYTLFRSSVFLVGDNGHTPWTTVSRALDAGTYTFEAGVRDAVDPGYSSQLIIDNITVTAAAVPEPASWALMLLGFGGIGAAIRRRRVPANA